MILKQLALTQDGSADQLRAMGSLAALVAGFVMVAFVQFSFDPGGIPLPILLGFGITNSLTVSKPVMREHPLAKACICE